MDEPLPAAAHPTGGAGAIEQALQATVVQFAEMLADAPWDLPPLLAPLELHDSDELPTAGDTLSFGWVVLAPLQLEGHPFDALVGQRVGPEVHGLILALEAWITPVPGNTGSPLHDDVVAAAGPDGRAEARNIIGVLRDGTMAHAQVIRGRGIHALSDAAAGRIPAALARCVGAPSRLPTTHNPIDLAERAWAWAALQVAGPATWDSLLFDTTALEATGVTAGDVVVQISTREPYASEIMPAAALHLARHRDASWDDLLTAARPGDGCISWVAEMASTDPRFDRDGDPVKVPDAELEAHERALLGWCDAGMYALLHEEAFPAWDAVARAVDAMAAAGVLTAPIAEIREAATRAVAAAAAPDS